MTKYNALIIGDSGIIGRHIAYACYADPDWSFRGISRRKTLSDPVLATGHIASDVATEAELTDALTAFDDITHVFYAARSPMDHPTEEAHQNGVMFKNVLDATQQTQPELQHVHLMQGMKWYGSHLGLWRTPAKESDPRHFPPNMYYTQHDELVRQRAGAKWTWSALRPHQISGFAYDYPHNLAVVIAVYGSVCRELGLPLSFPGSQACFESVSMVTDAELLGRAALHVSSAENCFDQAFNITNGDALRWCHFWPELADFFSIPTAPAQPISLETFMSDKQVLWQDMVARYNLQCIPFEKLVNWRYGDFSFRADNDDIASTIRLRQSGFSECCDSHDGLIRVLKRYREERVIP